MRVALFIIIIFLSQIADKLNVLPGIWVDILCVMGAWCLLNDYFESKKRKK